MNLEKVFTPYIKALESGIRDENWILATMGACTLPDICTSLEGKIGKKSSEAYIEWFNTYVKEYQPTVSRRKGSSVATLKEWLERGPLKPEDIELETIVYFSGVNAYALRCAFLHGGNGHLSSQVVQSGKGTYKKYIDQILDIEKVEFENNPGLIINQVGETAYINPEGYCRAITTGVINWIETIRALKDSDKPDEQRLYSLVHENASKMIKFE